MLRGREEVFKKSVDVTREGVYSGAISTKQGKEMTISKIKRWWASLWKKESKLKGLFLDDERNPQDVTWVKYPKHVEWVVVRSYDEFFYEFHRGQFQVIYFDHDIQDYNRHGVEMTGYTVLKAMIDYLIDNPTPAIIPARFYDVIFQMFQFFERGGCRRGLCCFEF